MHPYISLLKKATFLFPMKLLFIAKLYFFSPDMLQPIRNDHVTMQPTEIWRRSAKEKQGGDEADWIAAKFAAGAQLKFHKNDVLIFYFSARPSSKLNHLSSSLYW